MENQLVSGSRPLAASGPLSPTGSTAPRSAWWSHDFAKALALAAAPVFGGMALLTGIQDQVPVNPICSASEAWPLGGMVPMYLLMSAFHLTPWLRLIGGR